METTHHEIVMLYLTLPSPPFSPLSPPPLPPFQLMVTIGNNNANSLWEKYCTGDRLPADVEREIRETFIRAKYQTKSWIPRPTGESRETLSRLLCVSVTTDNLLRTVELLAHGANVSP